MLRYRQHPLTTHLASLTTGVTVGVLAALLATAPGAQAAPATPAPALDAAAGCGDSIDNWKGQGLGGTTYHDNDPGKMASAESTFSFPAGRSTAKWSMKFFNGTSGTTDIDEYRPTGPATIEFSSDVGRGTGGMWRFRLTAISCDDRTGKVTKATADIYIPPTPFDPPYAVTPTTHYGTAEGKPLSI
jgi:hypothetical protein